MVYKDIPTLTHELSLKPGRLNYSNRMILVSNPCENKKRTVFTRSGNWQCRRRLSEHEVARYKRADDRTCISRLRVSWMRVLVLAVDDK